MPVRNDGTDAATDSGYVPDRWEFNGEVTRVFEDMLERSIPQYRVMRDAVTAVARLFVQRRTHIVDLGCSRGEAMAPLIDAYGAQNYFVGVEVSEPMLAACRERFAGYVDAGVVDLRPMDLREQYPSVRASVTLAVLTMCFIPMEYRQGVIERVYDHTLPGGAFILVDKVLGATGRIDKRMVALYYALKNTQGYAWDEIERKRRSLEGVLVPVTAAWNEELLRMAGFRQVDCFWRWMNFAAWVAVRDEDRAAIGGEMSEARAGDEEWRRRQEG